MINDSLCGFFKCNRGLRQGDPLYLFLFVLCLEYLSKLLRINIDGLNFNFHPKCGHLQISHLAFANDLMLMARGDSLSVKILMECLRNFATCSGI